MKMPMMTLKLLFIDAFPVIRGRGGLDRPPGYG
jgi:hypothetical protein